MSGGTYSLFRAVYGVFLVTVFARYAMSAPEPWVMTVAVVGALVTVPFIIGFKDRWAALAITPAMLAAGMGDSLVIPLITIAPLAVHVGLTSAPYGSLDAAGRPDPAGDFTFPSQVSFVVYAVLAGAYVAIVLPALRGPEPTFSDLGFGVCAGLYLLLGIVQRTRFTGWVIMLGALFGRLFLVEDPLVTPLLFLHLLAFDPRGIAPRAGVTGERVFYDGACGLCHRAVRFVLAEDPTGEAFRFAPLGGEAFEAELPDDAKANLPDSIVLLTHDGKVLVRSSAIMRMMDGLGGVWRVLSTLMSIIPRPVRDLVYDGVAAVRHKIFKKPADVCPIIPKRLRPRFDL